MSLTHKIQNEKPWHQRYNAWLKRIGKAMARIRAKQGLTQSKMAEKTGFDMKYYQDMEYGRRPITTRTLFQYCNAIGIGIHELLAMAEG